MNLGKAITFSLGAVGAAAVAGLYLVRRDREHADRLEHDTAAAEARVRARLLGDGVGDTGTLRVSALTPGIVELSGTVEREEQAHRAVGLTQELDGIHTVVNRLEVTGESSRLSRNRQRYASGDPELTEPHWYGQRVGTGRRRQSPATDPDRRDDKVDTVTRELEASAAEDEAGEPLAKAAPAVGDHTTGPGAPTHTGSVREGQKRTVTEPREGPAREMNAAGRVGETPKPGVERAIEEAGLRRETNAEGEVERRR